MSVDLIKRLEAATETKQRELNFDLTQPGGMCDAAGGHWVEDEVQRHLDAAREILALHKPTTWGGGPYCITCAQLDTSVMLVGELWPCKTVLALTKGYNIYSEREG